MRWFGRGHDIQSKRQVSETLPISVEVLREKHGLRLGEEICIRIRVTTSFGLKRKDLIIVFWWSTTDDLTIGDSIKSYKNSFLLEQKKNTTRLLLISLLSLKKPKQEMKSTHRFRSVAAFLLFLCLICLLHNLVSLYPAPPLPVFKRIVLTTTIQSQSKCVDREPFSLGNTTGSVFYIRRAFIQPSPSVGHPAIITVDSNSSSKIVSEYERCKPKMWFTNNFSSKLRTDRLPIIQSHSHSCPYFNGTAIFIIEDGTSSIYHILYDYVFATFMTLDYLSIPVSPTTVVIMDANNYARRRAQPFYDSAFETVFGTSSVRNNAILGCFEHVVIGFFLNRLMVPDHNDANRLRFAKELIRPLSLFREHILSRLKLEDSVPADSVLITKRPNTNERFLVNEEQFLHECKITRRFRC